MRDVRIEQCTADKTRAAAAMLARAFVSNPLHVAAFGPNQVAKNAAFFRIALSVMRGVKLAAVDGPELLGVIHWVHSPACQFSVLDKVMMTPAMIAGFGVRSSVRVGAWLSAWSRHDPREAHSHLGPIGVAPEAQGQHIGRRLMECYCQQLDQEGRAGYLETDRPENVGFYARFGFVLVDEIPVLGVPTFLMRRPGRSGMASHGTEERPVRPQQGNVPMTKAKVIAPDQRARDAKEVFELGGDPSLASDGLPD